MTAQAGGSVVDLKKSAAQMARELYAGDQDLHAFVERAVAPPANSVTPGYAAELVPTSMVVLDFLAGDAPTGFAALAAQTLNVPGAEQREGAEPGLSNRPGWRLGRRRRGYPSWVKPSNHGTGSRGK